MSNRNDQSAGRTNCSPTAAASSAASSSASSASYSSSSSSASSSSVANAYHAKKRECGYHQQMPLH